MSDKLKLNKKNFSEWYDKILAYADIVDDRFPLKGAFVWKPYGYKALSLMMKKMEKLLEKDGHKRCQFPMIVPMSLFKKEKDFLEGFTGETLRITKIGRRDLDEELIVRPTSETIIYPMFSLWIRSYRDLPLKVYQIVPIFRWETKMTKPMLRVRELAAFKEAHAVHATLEDAEKNFKNMVKLYEEFHSFLKIPFISLKTPEWDTFAGALYNYDLFTILPDGKAVELGSVINLGQKFSKAYDIKYMDEDEKEKYCYQTTYGISERSFGSALAIHGDDKGLVFSSEIAPIQVVIVPVSNDKIVLDRTKVIRELLEKEFRVEIDSSDKTPGEKFYHWEAKGVPIRIEVGNKEVEGNFFTISRRDDSSRHKIYEKEIVKEIHSTLKDIDMKLYEKAEKFFLSMITNVDTSGEAEKVLKEKGGIIRIPWCGDNSCGKKMSEDIVGQALGIDEKEKTDKKCAGCGKSGKYMLHIGRTC